MKERSQSKSAEDVGKRKQDLSPLVPPDGGWGWAVVFGNSLVILVASSLTYCFGMVFVYLVQEGYSNVEVAVIPAVMNGITFMLAPVSTAMSRYYSHRRLSTIGIIMVSSGLLLCSFYNNIIWFYICYGVVIGIGNSLVQPQGFLLSQKYFLKRRVAANGLSLAGMSIGFMTVPLMINYFVQEYSYQGTFILWSGIVLHGVIGASLFQPVQWHMKPRKVLPVADIVVHQKDEASTEILSKDSDGVGTVQGHGVDTVQGHGVDTVQGHGVDTVQGHGVDTVQGHGVDSVQGHGVDTVQGHGVDTVQGHGVDTVQGHGVDTAQGHGVDTVQGHGVDTIQEHGSGETESLINHDTKPRECSGSEEQETFSQRKDLLRRSSEVRSRTTSDISRGSTTIDTINIVDGFGSCVSLQTEDKTTREEIKTNETGKREIEPVDFCSCFGIKFPKLRGVINFKLFRYPAFLVVAFSSVSNRLVYNCFVTYIPSIAGEIGIGKNIPYLFSCIAISELLAKLVMASISDFGLIPRRYFAIIASGISSIGVCSITFASGFWSLAACCSCYGFCVGVHMSVGPVLLVEYLGIKLLPYTYGLLLFMNGIGGIVSFILTGVLNDLMGSYLATYWVLGVMTLVAGILWLSIPCCPGNTSPAEERQSKA